MTTKKGESFRDMDEKVYTEELPEPFAKALIEIEKMRLATEPLIKESKILRKPLSQILNEMDDNIRAAAEAARKAFEAAKAAKEVAQLAIQASEKAEKRAEEAKKAGQLAAKTAVKAATDAARKAEETAKACRLAAEAANGKAEAADASAKLAVEAFRNAAGEAARKAQEAGNAARAVAEESVKVVVKEAAKARKTIGSLEKYSDTLLGRIKSLEERLTIVEKTLPSEKVILLREISKKEAEKEICSLFKKGETLYYSDIAERLNLDLQLVVNICNKLQKLGEIKIDDNALQSR